MNWVIALRLVLLAWAGSALVAAAPLAILDYRVVGTSLRPVTWLLGAWNYFGNPTISTPNPR